MPVFRCIVAPPKSDEGDREVDSADHSPVICTELPTCSSTLITRDICHPGRRLSTRHVVPNCCHNVTPKDGTGGGSGDFGLSAPSGILRIRDILFHLIQKVKRGCSPVYYTRTQAATAS